MGRYREPQKPGSRYITRDGYTRLENELRYLWQEKRPEVTQRVQEAAAQGDRSENAEYIYGKKQLGEIDRRIRFLSKRLDAMTVVDRLPDDTSRVFFGAWVELEDDDGEIMTVRLVGPDETDTTRRWISIDSPMARALLKKQVDDEVDVDTPSGRRHYLINAIQYEPPEGDEP
jgi:transcription elongation factor GreB